MAIGAPQKLTVLGAEAKDKLKEAAYQLRNVGKLKEANKLRQESGLTQEAVEGLRGEWHCFGLDLQTAVLLA